MGYGPITPGGKQLPITPRNGLNWMDLVNQPISQRPRLPGPVDFRGNPLPARPKAPGSWL